MSEATQTAEQVAKSYREFLSTYILELTQGGFNEESNRKDVAFGATLESLGVSPHPIVAEAMAEYGGMDKFRAAMDRLNARKIL